jgi:hypothetical protein
MCTASRCTSTRPCGHLMPTATGQAKVDRCVARGIEFFLGLIPSLSRAGAPAARP